VPGAGVELFPQVRLHRGRYDRALSTPDIATKTQQGRGKSPKVRPSSRTSPDRVRNTSFQGVPARKSLEKLLR